ncbi:MAG TPA: M1 family aminopeptidase, partial [Nitrococcus sp.]|nr:M1 family aminopeptidase [Nitrococcus sp.]
MMEQSSGRWLWSVAVAVLALGWAFGCAAAVPAPIHHDLTVRIDPQRGLIEGTDRLSLSAAAAGPFTVELNAAFDLQATGARVEPLGRAVRGGGVAVRRWRLTPNMPGKIIGLHYVGHPATSDPRRDDAVLVLAPNDIYLDPQSAWYPQVPERAVTFWLRADVPSGWRTVSEGRRLQSAADGPMQWLSTRPTRGIYLVAAPFTLYQQHGAEAEALAYLRHPDAPLARRYLVATAKYLRLYSRLIGPYPYAKFALVENTRQTGYAMPSFSLIGSQVLRLPFIPYTSYPHEILHDWWGNGVWVDYASGNWSEGLTTYLADQLLAEQRGQGAEARRAALQKYADFVSHARDFPLAAFKARHGEVTQAVGYDKGMMFFHMLRMRIGDARFIQGLRRFYADNRFR